MAAGAGKRFGGNKLSAQINNRRIFENIVDIGSKIKFYKKVIVTGDESIAEYAINKGYEFVKNVNPEYGISYTIRLGLNNLIDADAVMFCVSDQPFLSEKVLIDIVERFEKGKILVAKIGDKYGNPNIFDKKFFGELYELSGDKGGKVVVDNNKDDVVEIEFADVKQFMDIDTKDDLIKITEI